MQCSPRPHLPCRSPPAPPTKSSLLLAASDGAVLATSPGISKSGAVLKVSTPSELVIESLSWSAPPRVA